MKAQSVLIIDDEPLMRLSMVDALSAVGYDVQEASSGDEGLALLKQKSFDVVVTDLRLPGADGLSIVQVCKQQSPSPEVLMITAHGSVDTAVQAMKAGAHDYITKPFAMDELLLIVERAAGVAALRKENVKLRQELEGTFNFEGIVGKNAKMREILEKLKLVSASTATVLVIGESGTGKELVANAIHRNSPRRNEALIKVSCAALPETLLEAELFGHEKGAFTGALKQRRGRFELAHKGTLFLDEIGEISPVVQVKLLRVLQERCFERVGGNETIECDVRLVCATQRDLQQEVAQGRFREDLFYRLNVVPVFLPPLRERREDILILAEYLLANCISRLGGKIKGFSKESCEVLLRYSYPGNVRELENTIERAVTLAQNHDEVQVWHLCGQTACPFLGGNAQVNCGFCQEGLSCSEQKVGPAESLAAAREKFEREYIIGVLSRVNGSKTTASKLLGLSRKALWEKCKRYEIATSKELDDGF